MASSLRLLPAVIVSTSVLLLSATTVSARPPLEPRSGSIGTRHLQRHSVTAKKLAPGAVTRDALAPDVRAALDAARGPQGSQGPAGPAGAPGPQGPTGPGAAAIRYQAQASETPTALTALELNGLKLTAACQRNATQTAMEMRILSTEAAVIHEHFTLDTGTDPQSPGPLQAGNLSISLQAGVELVGGLPPVDAPNYGRIFATLLYASASRTMSVTLVLFIDAANERCEVTGVAVPAA